MKARCASPLVAEFVETGRSASCPVIDTHAHMGPYSRIYMPRNRAEDMIATMDRCGIRKTFFAHHRALRDSQLGNRDAEAAIRRFPDRFGGYWAVTPCTRSASARKRPSSTGIPDSPDSRYSPPTTGSPSRTRDASRCGSGRTTSSSRC